MAPATPPTNTRVLDDLAAAIHASPSRTALNRMRMALVGSETSKHPELMVAGAAFTPDGPLLGRGLEPVAFDDIPRKTLLGALDEWVDEHVEDEDHRKAGKTVLAAAKTAPKPASKAAPKAAPKAASKAAPIAVPSDDDDEGDEPKRTGQKRQFPGTGDFDSDLDEDESVTFDWTCNQVRRKINTFLESGEMKVTAFQKHLGVNSNAWGRFMRYNGAWQGVDNSVMSAAYRFFKQRERDGVKVAPKKRRVDAPPAADALAAVPLPGEAEDAVEIYDSCDEVRRKITAHLKKDGVTQASFLRDLARMFTTQAVTLQSKQLTDFRQKKGANAGNTSRVFYAAYVFFEKQRVKDAKPKSKHRTDMEREWGAHGGFDTEHSSARGVWVMKGENPSFDKYGKLHISGPHRSF